ISTAFGATVSARRHGFARGLGEPALLPLRRGAEDGLERHRRWIPFVRTVENHRGHEQIRADAAGRGGVDSGAGGRADRICRTAVSGGRVVASSRSPFCPGLSSIVRVGATTLAALIVFAIGCALAP